MALFPVPVWLVALSASSGTDRASQVAEVVAAFAVGNLSALLAERMLSRGGSARPGATVRWTVLASLSLALVSLLLVVMPFVMDGLRAGGVDDFTRWDGLPGLLRYWKAVVAFLLMVSAIVTDDPVGAGPRASADGRARARPVRQEARPAVIRARHPVGHAARG